MKIGMKSLIGNLLFAAVILVVLARFFSVWAATPFPLDLVTSGSMSPALMEGDVIAWVPSTVNDVKVGDVIVFKSWLHWPEERIVAHRVVKIEKSWGKPALETKGDANEFTDQSGPHIPEPYVSEKNFIGKVVSVGTLPLKIPFVGYLGIWVNEGFKILGRPTESKGSLTYVGVFTPLTISLILLIVSFYILPEKTRTIKEKLRLYILGSRPLNVKKLAITFLMIYIVFLAVIHVFAYDSMKASIGVGEFPEKSSFELGTVVPGQTSSPKNLPVVNPGVLPVKGIIFGDRNLGQFIDRTTFELGTGDSKVAPITATVPSFSKNGSYVGAIMVYSSPLWLMFPEDFMQWLCKWSGEGVVVCLDILSAVILTCITVVSIATIAFISEKYRFWEIDFSWCHAPKVYLKKGIMQLTSLAITKIQHGFGKRFGWLGKINLAEVDPKKPILASLVIIPLLLLINSEILAMIVATLAVGLVTYLFSCKMRKKIVFASVLSMFIIIIYLSIRTNYLLLTSSRTIIESIALGIGAIGIYILVLALFLIPLSLLSWYITHVLRNLKEQKDPLLILEGRCDL